MKIIIETPKWSFSKYDTVDGKLVRDFWSPIPCPINYGYVSGTKAEDGDAIDVVVPGPRLAQGTEIDVNLVGKVGFIDGGKIDHKYVTSSGGKHGISLWIFFTSYVCFKTVLNLLRGRLEKPKFLGIEWFDEPVNDHKALIS